MSPIVALTITRVGLAFDFLAFFLAAPELLGEEGLRKLQDRLQVILWWFSVGLFAISVLMILPAIASIFFAPITIIISSSNLFDLDGISNANIKIAFIIIGPFISAFFSWIPQKLMDLVKKLADNAGTRKVLLSSGIMMFILGALAQFIGTF